MIVSELSKLFRNLNDPVAAVRDNTVVYFNPAAEAQLGSILTKPNAVQLFKDGTVTVNHTEYTVTASCAFEHSIYFFKAVSPVSPSDELLQQVSSRLRDKIAELKLTVSMMTPHVENNTDEKTVAFSNSIAKAISVLHRMVGNLGYFQSFDRASFAPVSFDLAQCIGDIADSVPVFVGRGCPEIIFNCGSGDMTIQADRKKIELALYQILSNSLKHTPADGRITITLTRNGDKFTVAVSDTGSGLAPEQLSDLWNVGNKGLTADCGVGVGLPMVRQIAELHGGHVLLTSSSKGTSVTLSIPAVQSDTSALNCMSENYESGLSDLMLQLSEVIPAENFSSKFMD